MKGADEMIAIAILCSSDRCFALEHAVDTTDWELVSSCPKYGRRAASTSICDFCGYLEQQVVLDVAFWFRPVHLGCSELCQARVRGVKSGGLEEELETRLDELGKTSAVEYFSRFLNLTLQDIQHSGNE